MGKGRWYPILKKRLRQRALVIDVFKMGCGVRSAFRELELWVSEVERFSLLRRFTNGFRMGGPRWISIELTVAYLETVTELKQGFNKME